MSLTNMFTLNRSVARDRNTDIDDTARTKFALTALGYYDDAGTGLSPYADDVLFSSISQFQAQNGLKVDGVIKPDGPTRNQINKQLVSNSNSGTAFGDFYQNYENMKDANTVGADKYFHCKANYEAASRGWLGSATAAVISNGRELTDIVRGKGMSDSAEDQKANEHGRNAAKFGQYLSAEEACAIYRPEGLDLKY